MSLGLSPFDPWTGSHGFSYSNLSGYHRHDPRVVTEENEASGPQNTEIICKRGNTYIALEKLFSTGVP